MLFRTENCTSYTFNWASENMCLSQTACCPPGRIFASKNIQLIASIYPKEGNIYAKEIRVIATCSMQMKFYLAFLIPQCADTSREFGTGNVLELAKQYNNIPLIKTRFHLAKSDSIY